jgi:hypothetical protein
VVQQRDAGAVGFGDGWVGLERTVFALRDALGEVFAVVDVFEDRTDGGEVLVLELDTALLPCKNGIACMAEDICTGSLYRIFVPDLWV